MKRFLLFAGDTYYPTGGWGDFIDSFDRFDDAELRALSTKHDWFQIVDTKHMEIAREHYSL